MALIKWSDNIAAAALQGNYDGYIQSSLLQLRLTGPIGSNPANGAAVYNIVENTTYKVRLYMDTRFRVAACSSIAMNTVMTNYYRDDGDKSDTTVTGAYKETEITSEAGQVYMPVVYWASGGSKTWSEVYDTIEVRKQVTGTLELTTPPTKTQYNVGEELDLTGLVVSAAWSDGTKEAVTDYTVSGYDGSAAGTCTVVVTYQGETVSFEVTVAAASHILREYIGSPNLEDVVAELDTETWVMTISGTGAIKDFTIEEVTDSGSGGMPSVHPPIFKEHFRRVKEIVVEDGITKIGAYFLVGYASESFMMTFVGLMQGTASGKVETCFSDLEKIKLAKSVVQLSEPSIIYNCARQEIDLGGVQSINSLHGDSEIIGNISPLIRTNLSMENIRIVKESVYGLMLPANAIYDETSGFAYLENALGLTVIGKRGILFPADTPLIINIQESYNDLPITMISDATGFPMSDGTVINVPHSVTSISTESFKNQFVSDLTINIDAKEGDISGVPWGAPSNTVINWLRNAQVTGITITRLPTKMQYLIGDTLDPTGLVVSANYDDGTTEVVTDYTLSGFDSTMAGTKIVTVTYQGFTATFEVEILGYVREEIGHPNAGDVVAVLDMSTGELRISGTGDTKNHERDHPTMDTRKGLVRSIIVESGVTGLGENIFFGMDQLTSVVLPDTLTGELRYTFSNCSALKEIEIPGGVTSTHITFEGCSSLEKIVFNEGLNSIGTATCVQCAALLSVNFPTTLQNIGGSAFLECSSLKEVDIRAAKTIGSGSFNNAGLTKVIIGAGVREIQEGAFSSNKNLSELVFEDGIEELLPRSFWSCQALTNVSLPASIKIINDAFENCNSLGTVTILSTDAEITGNAFGGAQKIRGYLGSTAETYADNYGRTFEPLDILTGISLTSLPSKIEYDKDESFDASGMEVTATYDTGYTRVVMDYTVSGFDSTTYGVRTITVTYQGLTATFDVFICGAITGIRIAQYPNKVYYRLNETLDATGLQVVAMTEGGADRPITDYTLSELDSSTVGNKQITVTYEAPVSADTTAVYTTHFSVKVTYSGDNPFESGNLLTVTVHWPNGEFADLTNTDLAGGNGVMELRESICSDNYFIFGGCISNMLKFTTHSAQFISTEESTYPHGDIEVYVECKGTRIKIFTGAIDSGKRRAGLTQRDIIAYDKLYQYRNTDIAWWYKNKTTDKQMVLTQKQFRDELFDYLGIEQVPAKLYYDDAYVPNTNISRELNAVRIIKDMCLQNNVFGWVNRDGKFEYLKLPENSRRKSHDNAGNVTYEYFPATVYVDNYESCDFTEGRIWYPTEFYSYPEPNYGFTSGPPDAQEAYERNVYYNRNSFFIGNADWLDSAWQVNEYNIPTVQDPVFPICFGPFADIFRLYRAQGYNVTVRGNPLNKVGDTIEITVRKTADDGTQLEWVIHSYIMSRTLKLLGDTSMYDTYSARNAPYNGNNTQAGTYTPELSAEMFRARAEGPVISYADFDDGRTVLAVGSEEKKVRFRCAKKMEKAGYEALRTSGGTRKDTMYGVVVKKG